MKLDTQREELYEAMRENARAADELIQTQRELQLAFADFLEAIVEQMDE